ncbi:oligosaccharide flippase family protein [Natrinema limicola]|uniref:oligosaccharide flippase family protein n=1 Tax=Natrinema limicola TaxID=370323 RepID=UPI00135F10BC|nr:polysaccharide biosynthesis C-terminal domain-containing protein [Natrinema limicola]
MRLGQTSVIKFGSTLLASVAGFVATLYIAQELGSAMLGAYSLFIAVLTWLKTGFGSGLHYAINKRVSEDGDSSRDLGAGLIVQTVAFVFVSLGLIAVRDPLNKYLSFQGAALMILTLGVLLAFSFVISTLHGEQKVHVASLLRPIDRVIRSSVQLGVVFLSLLGGGVAGLVWGYVAGAIVATAVGVTLVSIRPRLPDRKHFENVLGFTRYSWLSGLEERSFSAMDTVVLGAFVGTNLIGYYEIAWNLASLLAIFATAIVQTLFPTISNHTSNDEHDAVSNLVTDGLAYLGLFLIPGLLGVLVVGEHVLRIYGSEFQRASTVLVILVAARLIYAYEAQFISTLDALNHPEVAFRVNLVFVTANLVLNVVFVSLFGWLGAAVATGTAACIGLILSFRALRSFIEFDLPLREFANQLIAAVVMGCVVWLGEPVVVQTPAGPILTALLLVGGGATVYFLVLIGISNRFRTTVRNNIAI